MDSQRIASLNSSDRYLAAVAAAGQAVIAVRSGMGISEVGIERAEIGDENSYQSICTPRRFRGATSTLRFLVAGEAAQVALGLKPFEDVCLLTTHSEAARVIRAWEGYWGSHPHFYSLNDDWLVDEVEEELKHLIWLFRWQVRRRLRYEPERAAVEKLALEIRDGKALSGIEAERFVRGNCHSD